MSWCQLLGADAEAALAQTLAYWSGWARQCTYNGPYRQAVVRSLITLKAMTYAPSGGIVAARTTSLPEETRPRTLRPGPFARARTDGLTKGERLAPLRHQHASQPCGRQADAARWACGAQPNHRRHDRLKLLCSLYPRTSASCANGMPVVRR